ncbi:MAG: hypothetical protein CM15mP103_02810 [Gammaproteobacteria bacterium]|nr:MAG: hypothetical protein CM15mP103_02810 [Gammaproteobacteria bacterium]
MTVLDRCGLSIEFKDDDCVSTTQTIGMAAFQVPEVRSMAAPHMDCGQASRGPAQKSRLTGLYLSGGSVHPGPGVPMATSQADSRRAPRSPI